MRMRTRVKLTLVSGIIVCILIWFLHMIISISEVNNTDSHEKKTIIGKRPSKVLGKRVLVTGAAGFIGMHLAMRLSNDSVVVGLDNFNDYYDVELKYHRAYRLYRRHVNMIEGDVCDESTLNELFDKYEFSHVAHMAAQAGVRYSVENPQVYIRENIHCFMTLLEVVRHRPGVVVVYASSSSVYGLNTEIPFSLAQNIDKPASMYGATKQIDEAIASTYHRLYGIRVTGLRFFTVYGPFGRPDMAVYDFVKCIQAGDPIKVFRGGTLSRDFTFVEDIVEGIVRSIDLGAPLELFNLGKGHPELVNELIETIEQILGKKAKKVYLPMQKGDVTSTFADISHTQEVLGYSPNTPLVAGIEEYIKWHIKYHSDDATANINDIEEFRQLLTRERLDLLNRITDDHSRVVNLIKSKVYESTLRQWEAFADINSIPRASDDLLSYTFFPGMDSIGGDIGLTSIFKDDLQQLKILCRDLRGCVGFNSNGVLKRCIGHPSTFIRWTDNPSRGLYVADAETCRGHLAGQVIDHKKMADGEKEWCNPMATCEQKSSHCVKCKCIAGYVGDGYTCRNSTIVDLNASFKRALAAAGGVMTEQLLQQKSRIPSEDYIHQGLFIKYPGKKHWNPDADETKGLIKNEKLYENEIETVENSSEGENIDDLEKLRIASERGEKNAPVENDDMNLKHDEILNDQDKIVALDSGEEIKNNNNNNVVHIVLATDDKFMQGIVSVVQSARKNALEPDNLFFHVIVPNDKMLDVEAALFCNGILVENRHLEIVPFDKALIEPLIHVYTPESTVGNLASPLNYARFYLHELIPNVDKVIYLDIDTIVQGDIQELWEQSLANPDHALAAVPRSATVGHFFKSKEVRRMFEERYGQPLQVHKETFNAGVFVMNIALWDELGLTGEVEWWMKENLKQQLWDFGSQPPMLLAIQDQWQRLDTIWNCDSLGWSSNVPLDKLNDARILHWSGIRKPWRDDGLYMYLWTPYKGIECSSHGECILENEKPKCLCNNGWRDYQCSTRKN